MAHTSIAIMLASGSLVSLAFLHSFLGDRDLLRPLFASPSFPELRPGRFLVQRTLRFAWHLTSLAWLTLAWLLVVGSCDPLPVAVLLAVSGVITHAMTRGRHIAWALFMFGALAAATASWNAAWWPRSAALGGALVLAALGCIHVAWAFGVRWGMGGAVPEHRGQPLFVPGRALTLLVAAALFVAAWLVLVLGHWLSASLPASWLWLAGALAAAVFALRTLGDGRFVGLFKRTTGTRFASLDDMLFTPLCFALCASIVLQLI